MKKRTFKTEYKYGKVLDDASQVFRKDLYNRIGIPKLFSHKKVLDLGCGYGIDAYNLTHFADSVVGADIDLHPQWNQFRGKKLKFIKGNSSNLPFKDNSFDGVYLKDLIHHVDNIDKTLSEIKRVTKPGGNIVIVEGNRYNPIFYLYATKIRGHDHFTQSEFKSMILNLFPSVNFLYLEAYPPFTFPKRIFKVVLFVEKIINKLIFLNPIFSYNVAVIKNKK